MCDVSVRRSDSSDSGRHQDRVHRTSTWPCTRSPHDIAIWPMQCRAFSSTASSELNLKQDDSISKYITCTTVERASKILRVLYGVHHCKSVGRARRLHHLESRLHRREGCVELSWNSPGVYGNSRVVPPASNLSRRSLPPDARDV